MPSETAAPAAKQQCRLTSQSISEAKRSGATGQSKAQALGDRLQGKRV